MAIRSYLSSSPFQNRRRALVKTLAYRVLMVLVTVAVALVVTEDVTQALNIGIAANVVKTGTYYFYERAWDRVNWGLAPDVE
jgi:uncharacterized membrane protein